MSHDPGEQKDSEYEFTSRVSMPLLKTMYNKHLYENDNQEIDENEINRSSLLNETISENLLKIKEIRFICNKTGLSPIALLLILLCFIFFIMIGYFEDTLTILIGTLYPLYMSIKTLQYGTIDDTNKWLCYWLSFYFFNWIEKIFYRLFEYIPFYFIIRLVFILFLYLPQSHLSITFYSKVIKPLYHRYHNQIREVFKKVEKKLYEIETKSHITNNPISNSIGKALSKSLSQAHFKRKAVSLNNSKVQTHISNNQEKPLSPFEENPNKVFDSGVEYVYDKFDEATCQSIYEQQDDFLKTSATENPKKQSDFKIKAVVKINKDNKDKAASRNKQNDKGILDKDALSSKTKAFTNSSISTLKESKKILKK